MKTLKHLKAHPLVDRVILDYDGRGRHLVELVPGWRFESCSSTMEIGTVAELIHCLKNDVQPDKSHR